MKRGIFLIIKPIVNEGLKPGGAAYQTKTGRQEIFFSIVDPRFPTPSSKPPPGSDCADRVRLEPYAFDKYGKDIIAVIDAIEAVPDKAFDRIPNRTCFRPAPFSLDHLHFRHPAIPYSPRRPPSPTPTPLVCSTGSPCPGYLMSIGGRPTSSGTVRPVLENV